MRMSKKENKRISKKKKGNSQENKTKWNEGRCPFLLSMDLSSYSLTRWAGISEVINSRDSLAAYLN